ncbi:MAG: M23 family metallopeptidase, partial [Steroidobacteraceae bacterium]
FDTAPAIGGPETEGLPAEATDLGALFDDLESRLSRRATQFGVLEQVIMQRELRAQIMPEGRPVQRGFLSSAYGMRTDPFTGRNAFHWGIDFAGNLGDPVVAVGAGVVTYVGRRVGYGFVVDVSHGDGFVTRYAHNSAVTVKLGETVTRGQQLALMGSTGRSTGPHVHFEVLRNGRPVNPLSYLGG